MGTSFVWRAALAGLVVVSVSGCLTTTEVVVKHPGAANGLIFQGCQPRPGAQTLGGPSDVDIQAGKDFSGPFVPEPWRWRVDNDSYRRFEVSITVRGAGNVPQFSLIHPLATLEGGDCTPVRWALQPTVARQGTEWKVLRYSSDYGGSGNWTLRLSGDGGYGHYDVRVILDYY